MEGVGFVVVEMFGLNVSGGDRDLKYSKGSGWKDDGGSGQKGPIVVASTTG